MAQKAKKDQAKANTATLKQLHIGSLIINTVFLAFNFLIKRRSLPAYVILSIPSLISEVVLERAGRPTYDSTTKALRSAGEDLSAPGLTEYMFDIVWITWFCLAVVVILGNWGWIIWVVVPTYGIYKGYGLLGMARGMMGGGQGAQMPEEQQSGSGNPGKRKQSKAA